MSMLSWFGWHVDFKTSKYEHLQLYIDGEFVESVLENKYLGTIIDNKFILIRM